MAHTQIKFPNRAVLRTVFATVVAAATLIPTLAAGLWHGNSPAIVGQIVVVSGLITRVLANSKVDAFIANYLPWLSPAPASSVYN